MSGLTRRTPVSTGEKRIVPKFGMVLGECGACTDIHDCFVETTLQGRIKRVEAMLDKYKRTLSDYAWYRLCGEIRGMYRIIEGSRETLEGGFVNYTLGNEGGGTRHPYDDIRHTLFCAVHYLEKIDPPLDYERCYPPF